MTSFAYNLILAILTATLPPEIKEILVQALPLKGGIFGLISFAVFSSHYYIGMVPQSVIQIYSVFEMYIVPVLFFAVELIIILEITFELARYL